MAHPNPNWKKGMKKVAKSGRKKGTPNKFTTLKQAFLDAFQDERIGGKEGLTEVFSQNDMRKIEFFKLISKMLPTNVGISGGEGGKPIIIEIIPAKEQEKEDKKAD